LKKKFPGEMKKERRKLAFKWDHMRNEKNIIASLKQHNEEAVGGCSRRGEASLGRGGQGQQVEGEKS